MEPLGVRLSALLRGRAVSRDHVWFRLAFLAHKLSGIVEVLQHQLEKLPIYDDPSKPETVLRLQELTQLADTDVGRLLDAWEQAPRCSLPWRKVRGETIERSLSWLVWKGLLVTHVLTGDADTESASDPELLRLGQEDGGWQLVGVDGATKKLRAWLTDKHDGGLKVVSIVGRAGVGKTTLAMELYEQIGRQFDCRVTAKMSRRPHKQRFLQHILDQITSQIPEAEHAATDQTGRVRRLNQNTRDMPMEKAIPSTEEMVSSIKKSLKNKRYLVVIDDIWDTSELGLKSSPLQENKIMKAWEPEDRIKQDRDGKRNKEHWREKEINERRKQDEANSDNKDKLLTFLDDGEFKSWTSSDNKNKDWEIIKHAFPDDRCGSRIIVTTRISSIARFCCSSTWSNGLVHEVKPLNDVDSERLFLRKAFGPDNGCRPPDESRQACDEILRICEGIPMFLAGMAKTVRKKLQEQRFSVCVVEQVPQLVEQFEKELSYSYNDLFYGLELLPLSMITALVQQKGCMIDKEHLIRAWVREGLIYSDHWGECEEKAEHCFSELVDRNIIRLATFPGMSETCHCQVDPFVLQFLVSKSGKVNFVTTSNMLGQQQAAGKKSRIVVEQHPSHRPEMLLEEDMDLSSTLSLTIAGAAQWVCLDKLKLGNLVVMDLEGWNKLTDEDLLWVCENIGKLKYLSVRNTRITKLPKKIHLLLHLRELDIGGCTRIYELPLEVCRLPKLEALDLRNTRVRQLPEQIGGLQGLRRLLLDHQHQLDATEVQQLSEI